MKRALLLFALLPLLACNAPPRPSTEPPAPHAALPAPQPTGPQNFDYFLLNLSWSPEYCYSHPDAAECAHRSTFVLHGLWPEDADDTFPENCSDAPGPADPSQYSDLYPEPSLLEHEWRTHGTCSGLSPDAYFTAVRTALHSITIPPELAHLTRQTSLSPTRIVSLFTEANPGLPSSSLAISCGHNYLTAVEVCLDKQLRPIACGRLHSCRANTVRIPSP